MKPTAKVGALQVVDGKTYEAHQVSASLKIFGLNLSCEGCAAKRDKTLCDSLNTDTWCCATREGDAFVVWKEVTVPTKDQHNAQKLCDRLIELGLAEDVAELAVMYHMADQEWHGAQTPISKYHSSGHDPLSVMFVWVSTPEGGEFWRGQSSICLVGGPR